MAYDYSKLMGKIVEVFGTQCAFAKAMGMAEKTLSHKLNNKAHFTQDEITKGAELLGIEAEKIPTYFFYLV